jgi:CrcB protein
MVPRELAAAKSRLKMTENITNILWIGFGGFLGSVSRYGTSKLFQYLEITSFPFSTLTVNILGSLLLGFLTEMFLEFRSVNTGFALFLTVGLCGGFTTFSTFTYENIMMIRDGQYLTALLYIMTSIFTGLLAFFGGLIIAKNIF